MKSLAWMKIHICLPVKTLNQFVGVPQAELNFNPSDKKICTENKHQMGNDITSWKSRITECAFLSFIQFLDILWQRDFKVRQESGKKLENILPIYSKWKTGRQPMVAKIGWIKLR